MTEENLTSPAITRDMLQREIMKYVGASSLSRDLVKLLLRQGAQENNLAMIKESTYEKLVDYLDLQFDGASEGDHSDLMGLMEHIRRSGNLDEMEETKKKVSGLIKTRKNIREKSASVRIVGMGHSNYPNEEGRADNRLTSENNLSNNESLAPDLRLSQHPYMEGTPSRSNQSWVNFSIVSGMIILSIICFCTFAFVTYEAKKKVVENITGWPLVIARG